MKITRRQLKKLIAEAIINEQNIPLPDRKLKEPLYDLNPKLNGKFNTMFINLYKHRPPFHLPLTQRNTGSRLAYVRDEEIRAIAEGFRNIIPSISDPSKFDFNGAYIAHVLHFLELFFPTKGSFAGTREGSDNKKYQQRIAQRISEDHEKVNRKSTLTTTLPGKPLDEDILERIQRDGAEHLLTKEIAILKPTPGEIYTINEFIQLINPRGVYRVKGTRGFGAKRGYYDLDDELDDLPLDED